MDEGIGVCGVTKAAGIGTFDDLFAKEVVIGGSGATGPLGKYALAVKNLLGAKIKLVSGYQGSASVRLAMQRGEVNGICGVSLSTVTSQWREDLEAGAFRPILQLSGGKRPELKDTRHVDDYARSADSGSSSARRRSAVSSCRRPRCRCRVERPSAQPSWRPCKIRNFSPRPSSFRSIFRR
jgi:hypothetical protein